MRAPWFLLLLLCGCSSLPEDAGLDPAIREQFEVATRTLVEAREDVPQEIADRLLPPVAEVLDAFDVSNERFDVAVRDAEAREFFLALVKDTPYNLVVHPDLAGTISLDLKSVTVDEVLDVVRELYGVDYRRTGNFIRVLPGGMRTEVYHLNYLNLRRKGGSEIQVSAGQVTNAGPSGQGTGQVRGNNNGPGAGAQQGTSGLVGTRITTETDSNFWGQMVETLRLIVGVEGERAVVATPDAGMIVVRAMPQEHLAVQDYLLRTELIMQRQVILEAKILEVILDEGNEQGVDWAAISELSDQLAPGGLPTKFLSASQKGQRVQNADMQGVFTTALEANDFQLFIELLETQGNVQVLSSPRIATVNNQKAVIKVGSDEFFVTEIRVDQSNNVNSADRTNTDVELTPFFSGIALDVTPQISENGRIILHVHPSISEVEDQTKVVSLGDRDLTLPLAFSTIRETDSIIGANMGQVVVIGGLIRNVRTRETAGVPVLGRLPVLGNAFRQSSARETRSELVILIRPSLADAEGTQREIKESWQRFESLGNSQRGF